MLQRLYGRIAVVLRELRPGLRLPAQHPRRLPCGKLPEWANGRVQVHVIWFHRHCVQHVMRKSIVILSNSPQDAQSVANRSMISCKVRSKVYAVLLPAPLALPQDARGQADGRRRHARRACHQRRALLPVPVAPVRALRSAARVLHLPAP